LESIAGKNKKMITRCLNFVFFLGLLLGLSTCISPFQADVPQSVGGLFVQSSITTKKGLQLVQLTRPSVFETKAITVAVRNAKVWVSDKDGRRYDFREDTVNRGYYLPINPDFVASIGQTYRLHISTAENETYQSDPETITPVPPIDRIYTEQRFVNDPVQGRVLDGYNVLLDTQDPAQAGNYYRWSWLHFNDISFCRVRKRIPLFRRDPEFISDPCCDRPCWDIEACTKNCVNVMSDRLVNGRKISRQFISSIVHCNKDYYIEVQQRSISQGAYDYLRSVDQLSANSGSVFDVAPSAIRGNIRSLSNPEEKVYGYFEASDVAEIGVYINRSNINVPALQRCVPPPIFIEPLDCYPCVESAFRTKEKPKFWTK
jgi:Domain of unknown function (DUF4249)